MICNIIAGSPDVKGDISLIKKYQAEKYIGVDYGAYLSIKNNINLDLAVGDFDSIGTTQFVEILNSSAKVLKFEKEKAKTDTELAIDEAIKLGATKINLFGATGRRLDHFLGTLNLFNQFIQKKIDLTIIDRYNKIYILDAGLHIIKKSEYKYISLFSFNGTAKDLTIKGVKYELDNYNLKNMDSLCVSNEIIENEAKIEFKKGFLLIVESND